MLSALEVIDRGEFVPCEVSLQVSSDTEQVFSCEQSLRLLPGRRLTCLASSGKKKYVIKIFPRRKRSVEEYEKEVQGYELLHNASIDVPARVFYGQASSDIYVIIYQYLSRARPLLTLLDVDPESKSGMNLMGHLLDLIIRLHRDGFIHEDPHLGNFLSRGGAITVLDTGAVRRVGNEMLLAGNFALFVAQFPVSWHVEDIWLEPYFRALHQADDTEFKAQLSHEIRSKQAWRERHILKKIYRECTSYHVESSLYGKTIINKDYLGVGIAEKLSSPNTLFDEDTPMLKEGNSSTVGVVHVGENAYVVKRYNIKNTIYWLKRFVRESRASRSWRNAHRLQIRGIPTARPVGMYECMKGKMRGVSVFAMEYLQGMHSADYFRDNNVSDKARQSVAMKMLKILAELKRQRISHGDLKSTNFILLNGEPYLIDLDAVRFHRQDTTFRKYYMKDIARFRKNWQGDEKTTALFDSLYEEYGLT